MLEEGLLEVFMALAILKYSHSTETEVDEEYDEENDVDDEEENYLIK